MRKRLQLWLAGSFLPAMVGCMLLGYAVAATVYGHYLATAITLLCGAALCFAADRALTHTLNVVTPLAGIETNAPVVQVLREMADQQARTDELGDREIAWIYYQGDVEAALGLPPEALTPPEDPDERRAWLGVSDA